MTSDPVRRRLAFRPPWWGLLLAVTGCAAGVALGNWQSGRAAEKRAQAAAQAPVTLQGAFEARYTVFLDNKLDGGRPGYHVVQPLRLAQGAHVLVNRGWIAAGASRAQPPQVRTPAGDVTVTGVRLERFARAYEPAGAKPEGRVWQNVTLEQFAAWSGLVLEPYVVEQRSAIDDGLLRHRPRADAGYEKNEMYALQWYSLAALSAILFFALNLRRENHRP
jgi:surfeit locus 1 family protein